MIYMNDFQKFYTTITELEASGIPLKLYGHIEEIFSGVHAGFDTPPNNTLQIRIAALATVGTIFCDAAIRLKDTDTIKNANETFKRLSITPTKITYNTQLGSLQFN